MVNENSSAVIDNEINEFDNMAIDILRIIELQRNLVAKSQRIWDKLLDDASKYINEIIPSAYGTAEILESVLKQLKETKILIIKYFEKREEEKYALSLQYKAKLTELLNKY